MIINVLLKSFLKEMTFTIYEINFQKLATEMFKVNNGLLVQLLSENFHFEENHNFRHQPKTIFTVDHVNTVKPGKAMCISDPEYGIPYCKK